MLSDRQYMREEYSRQPTSVLTWLLCAMAGGFIVQVVADRLGLPFERIMALSPAGLRHGFLWSPLTYTLLHGGVMHLLANGLGIYFLGRELLPMLGPRRFLGLAAASAGAGALVWLAVHFTQGGMQLIGASAIAVSLLIVFACFYPNREITLLLFFVLPVRVRPKIVAWVAVGIDLLGFLASELPGGSRFFSGIAYSAHLGGMLAGWVYYRYFHANNGWDRTPSLSIELPKWLRRRSSAIQKPRYTVNVGAHSPDMRKEVDRILDKINSHGFGSLSPEEKRTLDEAKDLLSRH